MAIKPKHLSSLMTTDSELTSGLSLKYDASNPNGYETPSQLDTRDTNNRNRLNHTGTQPSSSISDFLNAVLSSVLTGLSLASTSIISTTDTVLSALGKLQAQITANLSRSTHTGDETELPFAEGVSPATPVSGLKVYSRNITGRNMFGQLGKTGIDYSFQPLIARNKITLWQSNGNATSSTVIGSAFSNQGTTTTRSVANTSKFNWFRRLGLVSANGVGSTAGIRTSSLQYGRGNQADMGGFHFITRFGISDASLVANARTFAGLTSSTGVLINANPSTFLNIIGFGHDAGDANFSFMCNDGTGAATKIDLGADFAAQSTNTNMFEFSLFAAPTGTTVYYQARNLITNVDVYGSVNTNLPANTQLLAMQLWRTNNATATAVALDVVSIYMETDN